MLRALIPALAPIATACAQPIDLSQRDIEIFGTEIHTLVETIQNRCAGIGFSDLKWQTDAVQEEGLTQTFTLEDGRLVSVGTLADKEIDAQVARTTLPNTTLFPQTQEEDLLLLETSGALTALEDCDDLGEITLTTIDNIKAQTPQVHFLIKAHEFDLPSGDQPETRGLAIGAYLYENPPFRDSGTLFF
jgi:hypothetical protein